MDWLKIVTSNEMVRLATDEIVYILANGNYSEIMLSNGATHTMTFQLHYFEEQFKQLPDSPFTRVGRSVIVNKRHIRVINVSERLIKFGGHTVSDSIPSLRISLGRDTLKDLKKEMSDYEQRD